MLIIWGVAWRWNRREKRWVERATGAQPTLDSGIDHGKIDETAAAGPDFSHLGQMDQGP
jgi:hypothetical protein